MAVIPPRESSRLHLLVVTLDGRRVYLSMHGPAMPGSPQPAPRPLQLQVRPFYKVSQKRKEVWPSLVVLAASRSHCIATARVVIRNWLHAPTGVVQAKGCGGSSTLIGRYAIVLCQPGCDPRQPACRWRSAAGRRHSLAERHRAAWAMPRSSRPSADGLSLSLGKVNPSGDSGPHLQAVQAARVVLSSM